MYNITEVAVRRIGNPPRICGMSLKSGRARPADEMPLRVTSKPICSKSEAIRCPKAPFIEEEPNNSILPGAGFVIALASALSPSVAKPAKLATSSRAKELRARRPIRLISCVR
jgi:hypothetical protein